MQACSRRRCEPGSIPLDGASRAEIEMQHGAGELTGGGRREAGVLAEGLFGGGLRYEAKRKGDLLDVEMKMRGGAGRIPQLGAGRL